MPGHGVRGTAGAVIALLAAALIAGCSTPGSETAAAHSPRATDTESSSPVKVNEEHPYVGMWVTADNHIRQELLPNGRYDEARGTRASAYTGRYWVDGTHIEYKDDTGFNADGTFDGDVLHHGGYVFYREGSAAHRAATSK